MQCVKRLPAEVPVIILESGQLRNQFPAVSECFRSTGKIPCLLKEDAALFIQI